MIHVVPVQEPHTFHADARQPGNRWLQDNPTGRPKDLWSPFTIDLENGFRNLCGYLAMEIAYGEVDHYISVSEVRCFAYEWNNYRFVAERMNKRKGSKPVNGLRVLDPYEVQDGWFEVELPSLHLVATAQIPAEFRQRAELTLAKLKLVNEPRIIRLRRAWYDRYESGMSLEELRKAAPLIAAAIEKRDALANGT